MDWDTDDVDQFLGVTDIFIPTSLHPKPSCAAFFFFFLLSDIYIFTVLSLTFWTYFVTFVLKYLVALDAMKVALFIGFQVFVSLCISKGMTSVLFTGLES